MERVRAGSATPAGLELAAKLGHLASASILPGRSSFDPGYWEALDECGLPAVMESLLAWVRDLSDHGREAAFRIALAAAWAAVSQAPDMFEGHGVATLAALDRWVLAPQEPGGARAALSVAVRSAYQQYEGRRRQDATPTLDETGQELTEEWSRYLTHSAVFPLFLAMQEHGAPSDGFFSSILDDGEEGGQGLDDPFVRAIASTLTGAGSSLGYPRLIEAVRDEVVPWALGTGDPVGERARAST